MTGVQTCALPSEREREREREREGEREREREREGPGGGEIEHCEAGHRYKVKTNQSSNHYPETFS